MLLAKTSVAGTGLAWGGLVIGVLLVLASALVGQNQSTPPEKPQEAMKEKETSGEKPSGTTGKAGTGSLSFRLGYYNNGDSGSDGNPFLNEDLTVVEPIVMFTYNLTDRTSLWAQLSYDYVSSASIDRLSNFPMQSGATGDNYFGVDAGMRYALTDTVRAGGFFSFSTEYDYTSFGFGGDLEMDVADGNATLKGTVNAFFDDVDIIRYNGDDSEGSDTRDSISGTVTWYQRIAPQWHGELGATIAHQNGFLETAYNAVVIESLDPTFPPNPNLENGARGQEITEELPDTRTRLAVFGRVRRFFGEGSAIELGGRLYSDDWGITSIAVEPRFYTWLVRDKLRLRLRYRYYNQTEADAYQSHFFQTTKERTQDSDLADFHSHTGGIQFLWHPADRQTFDVTFDYVSRSDGIDQILASVGWGIKF